MFVRISKGENVMFCLNLVNFLLCTSRLLYGLVTLLLLVIAWLFYIRYELEGDSSTAIACSESSARLGRMSKARVVVDPCSHMIL